MIPELVALNRLRRVIFLMQAKFRGRACLYGVLILVTVPMGMPVRMPMLIVVTVTMLPFASASPRR